MIARIAAGLARNPAPEHRWRRVAVVLSASIFTLLLLAGTSVVTMQYREAQRTEQRTALWAKEPSPTDLLLRVSADAWRAEQFPAVWIEPVGDAKPVLPPGVEQLPKPGRAIVSPALDRLASQYPALDARYPNRIILDEEGVRSGDELFAYIRMPEGRTLAGADMVDRVAAFGPASGARQFTPLGAETAVSIVPIVGGVVGLLVFPGLIMLSVGLAAASSVRDHRFGVLRWIGAPGPMVAVLAVMETLILAVPGLIGAAILWILAAPRLPRVPLVGHDVVSGDLGLPWWVTVAELGVATVVIALLSVAVAVIRQRGHSRPRPGVERGSFTPLRVAPLLAALVAFTVARIAGGSMAADLNLAGILAAIIGTPLLLPLALRPIGLVVSRLKAVLPSIAGRGLQWDPLRSARPFAGGAALLVLVLAGSGFIAIASYEEAPANSEEGAQAVSVRWLDPQPADSKRLATALDSDLVVPTKVDGSTLVAGTSCAKLADYFPEAECNTGAPHEIPADLERKLASLSYSGVPSTEVRLTSAVDVGASGSAVVLGDSSAQTFEKSVRSAAMNSLPAPYIFSPSLLVMRESPLIPWLMSGLAISILVLGLGCLLSLVDRMLGARKHHRHLVNLGLVPRQLVQLEAWQFAVPYVAVATLGTTVGLLICNLITGGTSTPFPWQAMGTVIAVVVTIGLIGTVSVALLGARSIQESPE